MKVVNDRLGQLRELGRHESRHIKAVVKASRLKALSSVALVLWLRVLATRTTMEMSFQAGDTTCSIQKQCVRFTVSCKMFSPLFTRHAAILTMVNMTWVTNLVIFSGIGACVLLRRSIGIHCSKKTRSLTSSCFRTCRRTRVCFEKPCKIFATLLWQRYACALCWRPRPARV